MTEQELRGQIAKLTPPNRKRIMGIHKESDGYPFDPDKPIYTRLFVEGQKDGADQILKLQNRLEDERQETLREIEEQLPVLQRQGAYSKWLKLKSGKLEG